MTTSKEDLKKQFLLKRLEDPTVQEWEKKDIRTKLGMFKKLTEQDFDKPKDKLYATFFYEYIDQNANRLNKKNKTNQSFQTFSDNIKSIYYLRSFSATFESDCFWDYSEKSLKEYEQRNGDSLRDEKNGLLKGMEILGLTEDVGFLENYWGKDEITDLEIDQIQEKFWHPDFEKNFLDRLVNLIIKNKEELLELQDR